MASKKQARRKAASRADAARRAHKPALTPPAPEVAIPAPAPAAPASPVARRPGPTAGESLVHFLTTSRAVPYIALVAIFGLSVLVYGLLVAAYPLPDLFPDSIIYGKLSQSFAAGHGLVWRNTGTELPPLWPVLLSVVWHSGTTVDGFTLGKQISVVLASTTVLPVWLLARTLVGPRLALIPAALSVAGAWMVVTGFFASENLAYPLATAAMAAGVMALRTTRVRWLAVSLGFGALATFTRTQLLVLPVALVLALVVDVVRQPAGARRARFDQWPRLLWIALGVGFLTVLVAFVADPRLSNYDLLAHHVTISTFAKATAKHAVTTVVLLAVVPVLVVVALMCRASNWRDPATGPLLTVLVTTTVVMLPVLGRFEAWATPAPVDRYTMYLAPLALIAVVLAPGRVRMRDALIALVVIGVALLALPHYLNQGEQPALFGTQHRIEQLGGVFKSHERLMLFLIVTPIAAAIAWALLFSQNRARGMALGVLGIALIMVAQSWTTQNAIIVSFHNYRHAWSPAQRDWVDRHATGRVAVLDIGKPEKIVGNADLMTEFFSKRIDTVYAITYAGVGECQISLHGNGGILKQKSGGCAAWPREFVLLDGAYRPTLHGQQVLASTKGFGKLVRVPPGPPRVLSLVRPPCGPLICDGAVKIGLYLDEPATVRVAFGPTKEPHWVNTGKRLQILPPHRVNVVTLPFKAGDRSAALPLSGDTPQEQPKLRSVTLTSGGRSQRIY